MHTVNQTAEFEVQAFATDDGQAVPSEGTMS